MLAKILEPYEHKLPNIQIAIEGESPRTFYFELNPQSLVYLPPSLDALTSLEDVDLILGKDIDNVIQNVRNDTAFKAYFDAPFTDESMMLQAMIQKFKKMGEFGKERLAGLMLNMFQCDQGQKQAINEHYASESAPLRMADLQNVTTWFLRLQRTLISNEDLIAAFGQSQQDLVKLLESMLKLEHPFRQYFKNAQSEDGQLLRALLGKIVHEEKDVEDNVELAATLKQALRILINLSDPAHFVENLHKECAIHEIYLPANKFGDQFSSKKIEDLITSLQQSDIEGRGDCATFQQSMRAFVNRQDFKDLLHAFGSEQSDKLRTLVSGFINNSWSVGLLNLMELTAGSTLEQAIDLTYDNTRIDKDVPLTWDNLRTIMMRELLAVKKETINTLVNQITQLKHTNRPHDVTYLKALLGGAIGLRHPGNAPFSDSLNFLTDVNTRATTLQGVLDLFHQDFNPVKIIAHFNQMLLDNKLSIVDPRDGRNCIWYYLNMAAKKQLQNRDIPEAVMDEIVVGEEKGATQLGFALLLTELGILREIDDNGNPVIAHQIEMQ